MLGSTKGPHSRQSQASGMIWPVRQILYHPRSASSLPWHWLWFVFDSFPGIGYPESRKLLWLKSVTLCWPLSMLCPLLFWKEDSKFKSHYSIHGAPFCRMHTELTGWLTAMKKSAIHCMCCVSSKQAEGQNTLKVLYLKGFKERFTMELKWCARYLNFLAFGP